MSEVRWLIAADEVIRAQVVRVVTAVTTQAGAVGWTGVPSEPEILAWLDEILAAAGAGLARFAVVLVAGRIEALGRWERYRKETVARNGDVQQVMVHPAARAGGLARTLVTALVRDARGHGVEVLTLDVRGNNHAAMALYESCGFQVRGRLPDFVAVGDERWDRVIYSQDLRPPDAALRRHGARPIGPGASTLR
ncbi:MAG TPA: GNAT family N-acetyltransferase [Mycobacteriales bacterium]|nr:GNAT family N-acetyltransferase [Mycobacteriales bacterium]